VYRLCGVLIFGSKVSVPGSEMGFLPAINGQKSGVVSWVSGSVGLWLS